MAKQNDKARGFIEDIAANPDDDAPRLIYSDWLDEHGDFDRAEFIRVQIERNRLPRWDPRQVSLRIQEAELLEEHGQEWAAELPEIKGVTWGSFRRGFVAEATFSSWKTLSASRDQCWSSAPIECVSIGWPRLRDEVKTFEPISGLRELRIDAILVDSLEVTRLANSPLLSTLNTLCITKAQLGPRGFAYLIASPHLATLRSLQVPLNFIGNQGIFALVEGTAKGDVHLPVLEELDLTEALDYGYAEDLVLDADGVRRLGEWPGLARIRRLNLSGNFVQEGLSDLMGSPYVCGMKEFTLRTIGLGSVDLRSFDQTPSDLSLDVLDLGRNMIDRTSLTQLSNASCLRDLKILNLAECRFGPAAVRTLAQSGFIHSLRVLNLDYNSIAPTGLLSLLQTNPASLHTLSLNHNGLGDEGASILSRSPSTNTLLDLSVNDNRMSDDAIESYVDTDYLQNLLSLSLLYNSVSEEAEATLRESTFGKRLNSLQMGYQTGRDDDIPF